MALVYVQTIYAEDLGFRVQYTSLIPTSEPTETVPESEGPYNSDTHTIIDVYDDPSQGGGGGGDPVTIPYTGALQQVISGPGFTVLGSMTFDPSEFSTPEVMFTYTAMLTVPEGEVDARGRIRLYDMGDPESPEEVDYVVSSTLVNDDAGEIVYRTFDLVPGDDIASGLRLYEVRAEIRDYVEGCYLTIENASITSKGSASGGGGGGGGGGAPVDAPYLVFEPADGLPNAMGLAPSRSVQMMPIPGEVFFLQLDGDEDEPAPYSVYGTDGSGARGWFPSAGGGPVAAEDVTYDDELEAPELGTSTVQGAIDILKASSGGSPTLPFIWRPGGVASGNVYTTWSSLYAAVNAAPVGARNVIVDTSLSSATVVDEATQTCGNWSIKGWGAGATITLTNSTLWMGNASGFIELEDISIVQDTSQTTVNVFNGDVVALKATRCNFHVGANTAGFMAFGTTSSALRMVFTDCSFSSNFGNIVFMNRNVACTYDATFYGRTMMNEDSLLYTDLGTTTTFNIQSSDTAFRNAQTWLTGSLVVTTSAAAAPRRNPSATAAPSGSDNFAAGWAYGSQWIDTVGQDVYFCVGDGVWVQVNFLNWTS